MTLCASPRSKKASEASFLSVKNLGGAASEDSVSLKTAHSMSARSRKSQAGADEAMVPLSRRASAKMDGADEEEIRKLKEFLSKKGL